MNELLASCQIIEGLASQAQSVVSLVEYGQQHIGWPMKSLRSQILPASERLVAHSEEAPDMLAIVCWLHRDAMLARLDAEIDSESDDSVALSVEARQVQAAEVMGDLLAIERDECALVWRALGDSLPVEFRADTSPQAILGCELITAMSGAEERGGSSPEHSWSYLGRTR